MLCSFSSLLLFDVSIVSFPFVAVVSRSLSLSSSLFLAACAARVKLFSKIYDEIVSNFLISSHVAHNFRPLTTPSGSRVEQEAGRAALDPDRP